MLIHPGMTSAPRPVTEAHPAPYRGRGVGRGCGRRHVGAGLERAPVQPDRVHPVRPVVSRPAPAACGPGTACGVRGPLGVAPAPLRLLTAMDAALEGSLATGADNAGRPMCSAGVPGEAATTLAPAPEGAPRGRGRTRPLTVRGPLHDAGLRVSQTGPAAVMTWARPTTAGNRVRGRSPALGGGGRCRGTWGR